MYLMHAGRSKRQTVTWMDLVTFRIVIVGYMYVHINWTSPLILPL